MLFWAMVQENGLIAIKRYEKKEKVNQIDYWGATG